MSFFFFFSSVEILLLHLLLLQKNSLTFIKVLAFKGNLLCHQSGIIIIIF